MGLHLDGTLTTLRKVRLQVKEGQVHRPQAGMAWLVEGAAWRPEGLEQRAGGTEGMRSRSHRAESHRSPRARGARGASEKRRDLI